jgi:Fur family zinc uptake transcriptional regulator
MEKQKILSLLHKQNFRMTREREALLELFMNTKKMLTPAGWHESAHEQGLRVGLTTVYRLLEVLTKISLASPFLVDGTIYYTFCTGQHHHHFICLNCHKVKELYECPVFQTLPEEFEIHHHKVDLFGTCPSCHEQDTSSHLSHA